MSELDRNRCQEITMQLSPYLDGFLTGDELLRVEMHLDGCGRCRQELHALQATVDFCRHSPELDPPEGFHSRLMERVAQEKESAGGVVTASPGPRERGFRGRSWLGRNPWAGLVAAAAVVAVVALAANWADLFRVGGMGSAPKLTEQAARGDAPQSYIGDDSVNFKAEDGSAPEMAPGALGQAEPAQAADEGGKVFALDQKRAALSLEKVPATDRKIIKTAQLVLRVKDIQESYNKIVFLAESHGGFVADASFWQGDNRRQAGITVRVPSRDFDNAFRSVSELGEVRSHNISGGDVTMEYVDVETRLANRETEAVRVRQILAKAEEIGDILMIERELARIEGEIESLKGRLKVLTDQVELSTLTIQLEEEPRPSAGGPDRVHLGQRILKAFMASLGYLLYGAEQVVLFITWVLPYGALLALIWIVVRALRRRRGA